MIYKDFKDLRLSALGMGCMRLPLACEGEENIDEAATAELVAYALDNGINYFDTAWRYHAGNSEKVMGRVLRNHPRESFYLASKFPGFKKEFFENKEEIFEEQLQKCQVSYFDFYLCHNVSERNIDKFLDPQYGVVEYLIEQKRKGRIRHLGFSTHGSRSVIKRFLDKYRDELEFCQIQLNYLDWTLQNAKEKVALLNEYQIPIWVMEPVRGGRLAVLPENATAKLKALNPERTAPEWAFRYLQGIENVTMILSGMSNRAQLEENIRTFDTRQPLTEQEEAVLMEIADDMIRSNAVPCTGCSYCVEHCPQGIQIPELIKQYNEKETIASSAACIGCKTCETFCPQGIGISELMLKLTKSN